MSKQRLGRGLDALFSTTLDARDDEQVHEIEIAEIRPNPYQPRKEFDPQALEELSQSIREHGIIQPLVARRSIKGYELVAGERRLRAAKLANMSKVPVVLRNFTDDQLMEIGLIENLQREDLNAIEVAQAYEKLIKRFSWTQEELAIRVGKSRPHVANFLRLLQLPVELQQFVSVGSLSMGHARALLAVGDNAKKKKLAKQVIDMDLSVRELEQMVNRVEKNVSRETKIKKQPKNIFVNEMEEKLRNRLGTSVRIKQGKNRGKIEIDYFSNEDLERIADMLKVK